MVCGGPGLAPRSQPGGRMYRGLYRAANLISRALALLGGAVLLAVIGLTCLSILGRALVPFDLGLGPIRGIYDITEIGMAVAIFAFLPYAQSQDAHARVDLFQPLIGARANLALDLVFNTVMLGVGGFGTWRLYLGMQDKLSYGETTLIAQIPVWQGYAAGLVGAVGFVLVSAFCVLRAARRLAGLQNQDMT